jgi:hypothetical protein
MVTGTAGSVGSLAERRKQQEERELAKQRRKEDREQDWPIKGFRMNKKDRYRPLEEIM